MASVRAIAASLLPGLALVAPAEAAQEAPAPAAPAELHSLPFDLYEGRIYVQAKVAGSGPRTFLVDTGAQVTHLSSELAEELGLEPFGGLGIMGTGQGRVEGRHVRPGALDLGGLLLPVDNAITAPAAELFGPVVTSSGKGFDGIIGYDLFAAFVVEIDYLSRTIRLFDPDSYVPREGADTVPIGIVDNKPYVTGTVTLGGRPVSATFLLDTGSGGAIGFNGDFVAEQQLLAIAGRTLPSISRGVGGSTPARLGRADALTIGATTVTGPFVTYALAQGRGVSEHSAGRIGGALLRRFTVTINYPAQTIALVPNANFHRPLETDMSGLSLVSSGGGVEVFRVEQGSAADEAGIKRGDRLLSIDERPAAGLSLEAIRGLLMQNGATRLIGVLRAGRTLAVPLTLRRRI